MLKRLNVRGKLIVIQLVTVMTALVIIFVLLSYFQRDSLKQKKQDQLFSTAQMIAFNIAPTIQFLDNASAEDVLSSLLSDPTVTDALVTDLQGSPFAAYHTAEQSYQFPQLDGAEAIKHQFSDVDLVLQADIVHMEEKLGTLYIRAELSDIDAMYGRFLNILFLVFGLAVIIAIILTLWLQQLVMKPIKNLLSTVDYISDTGDYNKQVPVTMKDELGKLSEAFNQMIKIVKQNEESLENKVQERTHELEKLNTQLQLHVDEIQQYSDEQQQFLYVVSHDLKTPIRGISSLSSFIEDDLGDHANEEVAKMLQQIRSRATRMQNLLNALLFYSKAGKSEEKLRTIGVKYLVENVLDTIEQPENLQVALPDESVEVESSPALLKQVFSHLIDNAIRFNHTDHPELKIRCCVEDRFYHFCVGDNGEGIDEQHHQRIFELFKTLHSKDELETTGIGLPMVKKIVNAAGGRVWLESAEGKGCLFHFTLPIPTA